jgi:hypothetical protein
MAPSGLVFEAPPFGYLDRGENDPAHLICGLTKSSNRRPEPNVLRHAEVIVFVQSHHQP